MSRLLLRHLPALAMLAVTLAAILAATLAFSITPAQAQSEPTPEMRAKAYKVIRACKADIQQYCKGIEYGGGRVAQCLQQNQTVLKADCQAALSAAMTP